MPFVQTDSEGTFAQVFSAAGWGDRADVNVGVGSLMGWKGGSATTLELLPRFFIHETLGVGAHLLVTPGAPGVVFGPEVHGEWAAGPFVFAANVGWMPSVGGKATSPGEVWGVFAPEVYLHPRASLFFEVDPIYAVEEHAWSATLVPGIGVLFDDDGAHSASLGIGLSPGDPLGWSVGLAWTSTWDVSRDLTSHIVDVAPPPSETDLQQTRP
jgi:hypothetical protein